MKESALKQWLRQGPCDVLLRQCAGRIQRKAKSLALSSNLFPWHDLQDIVNELWSFAAGLGDSTAAELARCLSENSPTKFCFILCRTFINRILDKKRTSTQSTWHSYYRHVRQVISTCPDAAYMAKGKGSYYAFTERRDMDIVSISIENFKGWNPPTDISAPKGKSDIVSLAKFFYQQVKSLTGTDSWVAIRDLTAYIESRFPSISGGFYQPQPLGKMQELESSKLIGETLHDNFVDPAIAITASEISMLARSFVSGLDERQKKIFQLKYGEGKSLKQIATASGFKGASGVSYQLSLMETSLRNLCFMWPGLSPEDLNEAIFGDFLNEILEICKNPTEGRQYNSRPQESEIKETAQ